MKTSVDILRNCTELQLTTNLIHGHEDAAWLTPVPITVLKDE